MFYFLTFVIIIFKGIIVIAFNDEHKLFNKLKDSKLVNSPNFFPLNDKNENIETAQYFKHLIKNANLYVCSKDHDKCINYKEFYFILDLHNPYNCYEQHLLIGLPTKNKINFTVGFLHQGKVETVQVEQQKNDICQKVKR